MSKAPKIPLNFDELNLYQSTEDIKDITKFHVKNVVLTNPGEKISDPNFGVGIKSFLFESLTENTTAIISSRIRSQLARYLPHVEVLSVRVSPRADDNHLTLQLSYYIPVINQSDILSFSIANSTSIY